MSIAVTLGEIPALDTRDDLIAEVKAELNRNDMSDGEIKSFIRRAEARFNRLLRTPDMEAIATITVDGTTADLPTDFLQLRAIYDADKQPLPVLSATGMLTYAGTGTVCALLGSSLSFNIELSGLLTVHYWQAIPPLVADTPRNWLLERHPDLYFYGTLLGAEARIANDERIPLWKAATDETIAEIQRDGTRNRWGGPMQMMLDNRTVAGVRA